MINSYIGNEEAIILNVVQCVNDAQKSESLNVSKLVDPNRWRTLLVATKIDTVKQNDTLVAMYDDFHHTYKFDQDQIFFVGKLRNGIYTYDNIAHYMDKLKQLLPQLKDCFGLDPLVNGLVFTQNFAIKRLVLPNEKMTCFLS